MSPLRALLPGIRSGDLEAALSTFRPSTLDSLGLVSPLAPEHNLVRVLEGQVLLDVFGPLEARPVTRAEAMAVPAVARARHIIAGTVARIPLRAYRAGRLLQGPEAPPWIAQTSGAVPAYHRNLWTADDLLFHGWSCWARTNGVDRYPLRADRIPMGRWSVDDVGRVLVADALGVHQLVDQRTVHLIPGPHEGILTAAAGTIRHAADLQRAAAQAAKTPAAYLALRQTQGTPLKRTSTDPQENTVQRTVDDWKAARAGANGGVAFIPLGLEVQELGTFSEHLLTEGRNAAAVDVARVCSLPADLLDAAGPSSLTYQTTRDNDQRAIQYGVGLYLSALSAVHSQDGMSPHGTELRYSLEDWLESPVSSDDSAPNVSRETTPPAALSVVPTRESA